jgi:hypothetical protein
MRIRVFRAFASNNSGSYTLVGHFESVEDARAAEDALARVCAEHSEWQETPHGPDEGDSPLDRFAKEHGLRPTPAGGDDWPEYGPPPAVTRVDLQVLLHVPYTVTMPPLFGEFVYARGGRVALELDHAHHPVVVLFQFWFDVPWKEADAEERARRMQPFRTALEEALPELITPKEPRTRPRIAPAWQAEPTWGSLSVGVVFPDLVAGVSAVRRLAEGHDKLRVTVRLQEALDDEGDPLAAMRRV